MCITKTLIQRWHAVYSNLSYQLTESILTHLYIRDGVASALFSFLLLLAATIHLIIAHVPGRGEACLFRPRLGRGRQSWFLQIRVCEFVKWEVKFCTTWRQFRSQTLLKYCKDLDCLANAEQRSTELKFSQICGWISPSNN